MLESAQIEGMTTAERLQAMEQLWDAISRDKNDVASPEWHGEVLAARKAMVQRGEAKFLSMDQLRERMPGTFG